MADYFIHKRKIDSIRAKEESGLIADSMAVRLALVAEVHAGTKTLEQVQAELSKIQRNAKRSGLTTRSSAYRQS